MVCITNESAVANLDAFVRHERDQSIDPYRRLEPHVLSVFSYDRLVSIPLKTSRVGNCSTSRHEVVTVDRCKADTPPIGCFGGSRRSVFPPVLPSLTICRLPTSDPRDVPTVVGGSRLFSAFLGSTPVRWAHFPFSARCCSSWRSKRAREIKHCVPYR